MPSAFETFRRIGPAAFILKAMLLVITANLLLLAFILLRRAYRRYHFAKRDARIFFLRDHWYEMISGKIPYSDWRTNSFDIQIIETIASDLFDDPGAADSARLLDFLRDSGLLQRCIFDAREYRGWRRLSALVTLGQTRAPEGIPALAEGLRHPDIGTRLAALRGLGRVATPRAGEEILSWLAEYGLVVPALPVQSALVHCCAKAPQILMPYLKHGPPELREVLARVLGEVATPASGLDLLQFADDLLPEMRAATARGLSHTEPAGSLEVLEVLGELAKDPVWYVRLRAVVSLGALERKEAVPLLLRGLTDANRLVRLRSSAGLARHKNDLVPIFQRVVDLRDKYGLQAYFMAIEEAGLYSRLERELRISPRLDEHSREELLASLHTGLALDSSVPELRAETVHARMS